MGLEGKLVYIFASRGRSLTPVRWLAAWLVERQHPCPVAMVVIWCWLLISPASQPKPVWRHMHSGSETSHPNNQRVPKKNTSRFQLTHARQEARAPMCAGAGLVASGFGESGST